MDRVVGVISFKGGFILDIRQKVGGRIATDERSGMATSVKGEERIKNPECGDKEKTS